MRGSRRHWELEPERRSCRGRSSSHPPIRRSWCCLARKPLASSPRGCANMEGRWSPCRRVPAPPTGATPGSGRITAAPWHDVAPSLGFPGALSCAHGFQICATTRASEAGEGTWVWGFSPRLWEEPWVHGYRRVLGHQAGRSSYNVHYSTVLQNVQTRTFWTNVGLGFVASA